MRLFKVILFVLPSILVPRVFATGKGNVLVCYGRLDPHAVKGYGCVIVEQAHYTDAEVRTLKAQNDKVLAYLSLGEVNTHAAHYPALQDHTLGKNGIWNSHYLDLSAPETTTVLINLIEKTLNKGYDGFFLDNFDNFGKWGKQSAHKPALVSLLKKITAKYPNHDFWQNAGIDLIGDTAAYIDGVVVESVATNYDFAKKKYQMRSFSDFTERADSLTKAANTHKLPVIVIEYADTKGLRDDAERRIKPLGFDFFIGQIDLQTIPQFKPDRK